MKIKSGQREVFKLITSNGFFCPKRTPIVLHIFPQQQTVVPFAPSQLPVACVRPPNVAPPRVFAPPGQCGLSTTWKKGWHKVSKTKMWGFKGDEKLGFRLTFLAITDPFAVGFSVLLSPGLLFFLALFGSLSSENFTDSP